MGSGSGTSTCGARRRDGSPCRAPAGEDGYCFGHTPRLARERERGQSAGGRGRSSGNRLRKAVPSDLQSVLERLIGALERTEDGVLEARVAQAMASLAGAIVRVYEVGELATRVEQLERRGEDGS